MTSKPKKSKRSKASEPEPVFTEQHIPADGMLPARTVRTAQNWTAIRETFNQIVDQPQTDPIPKLQAEADRLWPLWSDKPKDDPERRIVADFVFTVDDLVRAAEAGDVQAVVKFAFHAGAMAERSRVIRFNKHVQHGQRRGRDLENRRRAKLGDPDEKRRTFIEVYTRERAAGRNKTSALHVAVAEAGVSVSRGWQIKREEKM